MNWAKYIIGISIVLGAFDAAAQIPTFPGSQSGFPGISSQGGGRSGGTRQGGRMLDDSTKQIYGPNTSLYFYEQDVFNNRKKRYPIDTTIDGFHQASFTKRNQNRLVDLGNLGTASRWVFYEVPTQIGAQAGFDVNSAYAFQTQQVKYFDTKSPYSNIFFTPGGNGQNILNFDFTRNIHSRLNAGFNIQRATAIKQFDAPKGEENIVGIWGVLLHANYVSKNQKYAAMGHFNLFDHKSNDQGGVLFSSTFSTDTLFKYGLDQGAAYLKTASSREKRNSLHGYHEYKLANGFQLYHVIDYQYRTIRFADVNFSRTADFYKRWASVSNYDSTRLDIQYTYKLFENKVGIKGFYKGYNYRIHLRRRDYSLSDSIQQGRIARSENFLGIWLNYYFPDSVRKATAEFEYLIAKDYRFHAEYQSPFITAGFTSSFNSPTLLQQRFIGGIVNWDNTFSNVFVNNFYGKMQLKLKNISILPEATYSLIKNYIYFDTLARPQQTSVPINVFRIGGSIEWRWKKLSTLTQLFLTTTSGADVIRMPKVFWNSRLAYDLLFRKVLYIQAGLELHYKSSYYADAYLPVNQQFYLNNSFLVNGYIVADAFADFRINRVRLFVKMSHVNQGLMPTKGYFSTPYFPAIGRTFGFGVNWPLFD
ncbi:MAG: putative porin [Spirosomataceae bacterium]